MTIMARYSGVCPECGERWQPGDLIRAQMGDYGVIDHWQHAVCPDPITDGLIGTACPVCWLVHPEGECDR